MGIRCALKGPANAFKSSTGPVPFCSRARLWFYSQPSRLQVTCSSPRTRDDGGGGGGGDDAVLWLGQFSWSCSGKEREAEGDGFVSLFEWGTSFNRNISSSCTSLAIKAEFKVPPKPLKMFSRNQGLFPAHFLPIISSCSSFTADPLHRFLVGLENACLRVWASFTSDTLLWSTSWTLQLTLPMHN